MNVKRMLLRHQLGKNAKRARKNWKRWFVALSITTVDNTSGLHNICWLCWMWLVLLVLMRLAISPVRQVQLHTKLSGIFPTSVLDMTRHAYHVNHGEGLLL